MRTSQLAMRSLELFHARSSTDSPSAFRMAKMRLIGEMLERLEYGKLAASLAKSSNDLEYYKALLHGPNFTMNTGGKLFGRIKKTLVMAYGQGADLSDLLPVLEDRLGAEFKVDANISQAHAALNILVGFLKADCNCKPSKMEVATALMNAAKRINLSTCPAYQEAIYTAIKLELHYALLKGVEMPDGMEAFLYYS